MGAEQSSLLGYTTGSGYTPVALDASEAEQRHDLALATLLQRAPPMNNRGGPCVLLLQYRALHGPVNGKPQSCLMISGDIGSPKWQDASPSPLSDLGNKLNMQEGLFAAEGAAQQKCRKASSSSLWKVPLPSWSGTPAPARPMGLADLGGSKTPPLCEVSFCSTPQQQCVLETHCTCYWLPRGTSPVDRHIFDCLRQTSIRKHAWRWGHACEVHCLFGGQVCAARCYKGSSFTTARLYGRHR